MGEAKAALSPGANPDGAVVGMTWALALWVPGTALERCSRRRGEQQAEEAGRRPVAGSGSLSTRFVVNGRSAKRHGISEQTIYTWCTRFGALQANHVKATAASGSRQPPDGPPPSALPKNVLPSNWARQSLNLSMVQKSGSRSDCHTILVTRITAILRLPEGGGERSDRGGWDRM